MDLRFAALAITVAMSGVSTAAAQGPAPDTPRPIDSVDSVFIEELTWMEVRDEIAAGKTTALIATGGIEQNGPYLVTGKHNVVLRAMADAIARELGNVLVAPIVKLVPEGDFDPPSGHMRFPGTIGLSQETFKAVLRDICKSLKVHGFRNIVMIGDSGGNQRGMEEVADELNRAWGQKPAVHYIAEFYDYPGLQKYFESKGIHQESEGIHDDFQITSIMATVDPTSVRYEQRVSKGLDSINGVPLTPLEKTLEMGRLAVAWRTEKTVEAIRGAIQSPDATQP